MNQIARRDASLQDTFITLRRDLERYIARRVKCPQLAEDLATEIFLRTQRIDHFVGSEAEARQYLYKVALRLSIDHTSTVKRHAKLLEGEPTLYEAQVPSAEAATVARSQMAIVDEALGDLPDKARAMLFQSRVAGMTHSEIAAEFGVTKSLVEKYIMLSLRHCRQKLREAEGDD